VTDSPHDWIPRKLFALGDSGEYRRWTFEPREYPALPEALHDQLREIEPTVRPGGHCYWPVQAVLRDGRTIDCVCLMDAAAYMVSFQRPWPELLRDATAISVLDIEAVRESPVRLPARLADRLRHTDEFRAGASAYSLLLEGGATRSVIVSGLLDFTSLPTGTTTGDIVDVTPLVSGDLHEAECQTWCLTRIED
jgi:hypothetical protein